MTSGALVCSTPALPAAVRQRRYDCPPRPRCARYNPTPQRPPARRDRVWYNPEHNRSRTSRTTVQPKPVRRWIESPDLSSVSDSVRDRFVVVSHNILGVHNASKHRDLYINVPPSAMNWNTRKELICEEIIGWNADIVCLQEVDRYHDILSILGKVGYVGNFKRRTGESKDGCALFWKEKQFRLIEEESINFSSFGLRDNVAQLFVFQAVR